MPGVNPFGRDCVTIEFNCPECGKLLRTGDEKAGVRAKCPDCGGPIQVPHPEKQPVETQEDEFDIGADDEETDGYRSQFGPAGPATSAGDMQSCPMCGEQIKAAAVRCRYCGEDLSGGIQHAIGPAVQLIFAGFWLRFVAYLLDSLIIAVPVLFLFCLVSMILVGGAGQPPNLDALKMMELPIQLLFILMAWPYFALMESSSKQATLGKLALGLAVTDASGGRISFGRATGRYFGKILSGMSCYLGFIMAGFTDRKQALHDIMANCLVVRR